MNTPKPLWDKLGRSFVSQSVANLSLPTLPWSEFVGRIMPLPLIDAGKFPWRCDRSTQCPSDSQLLPHSINSKALNLFVESRFRAIAFEQEYWTWFIIGSLLFIFVSAERAVDQNWKRRSLTPAIF